ncbi:MAG: spondin domain-containing protein [Flavobacteriaceae bacterium]|nr:spondin domain-containing protein [Flavobacteriaceae bacterium]
MKKYFLWILAVVFLVSCKKDKDEDIVIEMKDGYEYTFQVYIKGFWSKNTHPTDFPTDAKFGKIIGISHQANNLLFENGERCSEFLKSYFQDENTALFSSYFNEFKEVNKVTDVFVKDGFSATESTTFKFTANSKNDKLSLLMKLSPSPDWFVGINSIDLNGLASGGAFTYILPIYDAGCFDGKTYTEKGSVTNNAIQKKIDTPVNYPNGGVNNFAIITIGGGSSVKITE